jgi:hypothetical protein
MDFRDELLEQLILDGIVEFAGLDKNGEMLYSFAEDIATKAPGIFEIMMDMRLRDIRQLWALGYLQMNISDSNPTVRLTKLALDNDALDRLDPDLRIALDELKQMMQRDE